MWVNAGLTGIKLTGWHSCLWHKICTVNETLLCLCDGESFTTGLLNISWNSQDCGSNLILNIAEWAGICFSISMSVSLSILQFQLYTVCVCVCVSISQRSYICSCYLKCGANKDNAVSRIQICREGFANVKCFLSPSLTHSYPWRSHKPNLIFWTLGFFVHHPPHAIDWPLTLQLAAPFLFPAGCDKVAQLASTALR